MDSTQFDIDSRETALDRGVTLDLIDLWSCGTLERPYPDVKEAAVAVDRVELIRACLERLGRGEGI